MCVRVRVCAFSSTLAHTDAPLPKDLERAHKYILYLNKTHAKETAALQAKSDKALSSALTLLSHLNTTRLVERAHDAQELTNTRNLLAQVNAAYKELKECNAEKALLYALSLVFLCALVFALSPRAVLFFLYAFLVLAHPSH